MGAENYKNKWLRTENQLLGDKAEVELVNGIHMTICRYKINKKLRVPQHSHEYEQTIYVLQGEISLKVDNEQFIMTEGDVCVILSNTKHSAEITGIPFQSIESYYPKRSDLLEI